MPDINNILNISPIIPVAVIPSNVESAQLAQALLSGGVGIIEVTLRTDSALKGIAEICDQVSGMCVGAGTVWNGAQRWQQ